jgi:hypothetical protein
MSVINNSYKFQLSDPKTFYSNKLLKMSSNCISFNINNAKNTINCSYNYLTIVYHYLQKIKEDLDSLNNSDILHFKLLGILKIMSIYVNEIDYVIKQAIYDDKQLIVSPDSDKKQITFAFAFPYNYTANYPIGIPISSAANNFIFTYKCPIINSDILKLDIVTNPLIIFNVKLEINFIKNLEKKTLIKIGNTIGIYIDTINNESIINIFYNNNELEELQNLDNINDVDDGKKIVITNLDGDDMFGTIISINSIDEIENYREYKHISTICCYLQYVTDNAIKYVWDYIDKISYYLFVCEINTKLLSTFRKRII